MNKSYGIHDKWTDLDKVNNVEINSIDGVIESVKINGEEAGGGGSSDFSTATVTTINNSSFEVVNLSIPIVCEENELGEGSPAMIHNQMVIQSGEETHKVCMYKGLAFCAEASPGPNIVINVSGDIVYEDGNIMITGNGTITIS